MIGLPRNMSLKTRLYAFLISMLLGLFALGAYSVYELRQQMLAEKRLAIRAVVNSAIGVLQHQYELQQAGKLTQEEAQHVARTACATVASTPRTICSSMISPAPR